ncbi:histone deacetylase complex protein [Purpureocillium lavendulum]|uniref:Histone deacetylase complex protein n=1 Tax=Purpureocillium lavendulum TaxID=1247861 RepID=A0AB34FUY7_9HYPO|nr:histone deacetylase complex protein [Purpureocillium lavendulum]
MKGRPVEELVYECMFPKPKSNDPVHFSAFLQRYLIPEVRQETHSFYGHLDTQEAKYPGLDYNHTTHRIRLSRWPWHRRLFRAFNNLDLTANEIAGLTKWEGTKWAKEKFEKEQGIIIRDTTDEGFPHWTEIPDFNARDLYEQHHVGASTIRSLGVLDDDDDEEEDDETDGELESVGVELNERLRAQAARREAGETSAVLDEEWEQWLKHAIESGELTIITERITDQMLRRAASSSSVIPAALVPPSMLSAARAGQWSEVPELLQPVLRRTIDAEDAGSSTSSGGAGAATPSERSASPSTASSRLTLVDDAATRLRGTWPRRRSISGLRLPVGEASAASRTAEASGA